MAWNDMSTLIRIRKAKDGSISYQLVIYAGLDAPGEDEYGLGRVHDGLSRGRPPDLLAAGSTSRQRGRPVGTLTQVPNAQAVKEAVGSDCVYEAMAQSHRRTRWVSDTSQEISLNSVSPILRRDASPSPVLRPHSAR